PPRGDQFVDLGVDVLHACIRQHDWGTRCTSSAPTGLEQHSHAVDWCERVDHAPRQNPSREVVDDGVQIGACRSAASGPATFIFASTTGAVTGWNAQVSLTIPQL